MEEREIYPNAPVVLVAIEVRHPLTEPLGRADRARLREALASQAPIAKSGQLTQAIAVLDASGGPAAQQISSEEFPRFISRDHGTSIAFRRDAIVIETTRYERWESLRDLTAEVLHARVDIGGIDGVERLGLRYVDEIRVPVDGVPVWEEWVDRSLVGPAAIIDRLDLPRPDLWQGLTIFPLANNQTVALRYGSFEGYAVSPTGELKRSDSPAGPFFLMDIDSFWIPGNGTPEFDTQEMLDRCDSLHAPVRSLFENLISDRLRIEVLRES